MQDYHAVCVKPDRIPVLLMQQWHEITGVSLLSRISPLHNSCQKNFLLKAITRNGLQKNRCLVLLPVYKKSKMNLHLVNVSELWTWLLLEISSEHQVGL